MKSKGIRIVLCCLFLVAFAACDTGEKKIQEHMDRGDAYFANEEFPEAIIEYRNVLQLDPNFVDAHLALSKSLFKTKKTRDGYWELGETIRLDPSRSDLRLEYGEISRLLGQWETALEQAEAILDTNSEDADAWLLKARTLHGLKRLVEAREAYAKAIENGAGGANYYLAASYFYLENRELEKAETHIQAAIENDPSYVAYASMASFLGDVADRSDEAEAWWKKAIEVAPEESLLQAYRSLANYYFIHERYEEAETTLNVALEKFPGELELIYLLARFYSLRGDEERADELVESATEYSKDDVKPYLTLAAYRHRKGDMESAVAALDDALKIDPGNVTVRLRLADLYLEQGYLEKDEELIGQGVGVVEAVLLDDENDPEALYLKAKIEIVAGNLGDAIRRLKRVVEVKPDWAQAHLVLGTSLLSQGDLAGARTSLTRALQIDGSLITARKILAQIYERMGESDLALEEAQKVIRANPNDDSVRIILAQNLIREKRLEEAEKQLEAIPADRRGLEAVYALGRVKLFLNKFDEARTYLLRANELNPNHPEVLESLFQVDVRSGRLGDTVERLKAAIEVNPDSAELLFLQGRVFNAEGRTKDAAWAFRKVIDLDPNHFEAYSELARGYARAGQTEQVLHTFEKAVEASPGQANVHLILGTLYEAFGEKEKAQASYEEAIRIDPNLAAAKNNLAYMLAESGGDLDRALDLAQEAKAILPSNANIADTLGWVLYKKKIPSAAITYLKEAERGLENQDPSLGAVRYHLALAYDANEEDDKAKELLQLALGNLEERRRVYKKKTGLDADLPEWAVGAQELLTKLGG